MAHEIVMPRLSDSMEEGTILKWLKAVGDEVKRGDELVEIETDKANMVYQSDADGVLAEIVAAEGDTLALGEVIARLGAAGDEVAAKPRKKPAKQKQAAPAAVVAPPQAAATAAPEAAPAPVAQQGTDGRVKASPVARRMARELGIALEGLGGSGPGGRIVKADVEAAAAGGGRRAEAVEAMAPVTPARPLATTESATKGEVETFELSKLQQTVARRMAESKATAPHFYLQAEVDMVEAVGLRGQLKALAPDAAPSFNDMVVKAVALALREHPRANGAYRDGKVEHYSRVNVGVAVAAREALVVPTVFDADTKSLGEIARETKALAARTREGTITPPELSGGTFTVSNLGMYGIENFQPVINPPQAGTLAVGALHRKAVVDGDGRVVARETMGVTLACDHRILYGAEAANFLGRVRELLEAPVALTL